MSDSSGPGATPTTSRYKRHIPLVLALVGGITLLIVLSVGSVLVISLRGATENTFSLLADKTNANLDLLETQLGSRLDPVAAAGTALSIAIGDDGYYTDDARDKLRELLRGALSALPDGTAAIFVRADSRAMRMARVNGRIQEIADNPTLLERQRLGLRRAFTMEAPGWVEPVWLPLLREPILSFVAPVLQEGSFFGAVIVSVRLGNLARFLARLEIESGVRAFVLYDNKYVLGHRDLLVERDEIDTRAGEIGLPTIEGFNEDSFRLLNNNAERASLLLEMADIDDAPLDDEFILLIRGIDDYGPAPWQIGLRFRQQDVSSEVKRIEAMALAGLAILLIAVIVGYLFARNLNHQIGRLARASEQLSNLETTEVANLPDSRIREFANAASAFNAMIAAMRWFETYVPKTLVLRLMQSGSRTTVLSEERVLTILFSDIRNFSSLVEHMDPAETASLLNRHFEVLASCIEAEGGTVDKFMGDSIMAFWGAPEEQLDHAARALRAAVTMRAAITAENKVNREAGRPAIAIRIGIHTGPVVVGNIGSRNRVNYTVIGDTVNVAARLEAFAKELGTDDDCAVLLSGATLGAAGADTPAGGAIEQLGDFPMRGRAGVIEVYRLTG